MSTFPSRTETAILLVLQLIGLICAGYGIWFQYVSKMSLTGIFYCTLWYILCGSSHILGVVSILFEMTEQELAGTSQSILQYHYLTIWLGVVIGYPLIVTYTWMMYYPTVYVQIHLALAIIPLIGLLARSTNGISRTTQICTGFTCASHAYICWLAHDPWGQASAFVMAVNILALSMPTRYHVWEFSSKELFIIGVIFTSYLMNLSIMDMGKSGHSVKSLSPF